MKRYLRRAVAVLAGVFGFRGDWRLLRWLIPTVPCDAELQAWRACEAEDYGRWCDRRELTTAEQWVSCFRESVAWDWVPRISIVTPVYNTDSAQLISCIASVRAQTYPFWQLCLVDDASHHPAVRETLEKAARKDPRIVLSRLSRNQGICRATNAGISAARGDWVAFLDHDDTLTPDALHCVALAIRDQPNADVFYSDRDMLSVNGRRFMHLLKPAWSPETLLSGNYLFHLTVYRRSLLDRLGGVRPAYEGSQDYDLILRASEITDQIRHVPRVLYHWREHAASIATNVDAKAYVYDAGKAALADAMARRGAPVGVTDVEGFRGHYRPCLPDPDPSGVALISADADPLPVGHYREWLHGSIEQADPGASMFVICGPGVSGSDAGGVHELLRWLQLPGVGMASGRVVTPDGRLAHAGLVHRPGGVPLALYQGCPTSEPGYMAYAAVLRNVSAPHPWCVGFRREVCEAAGGLSKSYVGPHAMLDLALRALASGWRAVYVPYAEFQTIAGTGFASPWYAPDVDVFARRWSSWLGRGDPYYPVGMSLKQGDMRLAEGVSAYSASR